MIWILGWWGWLVGGHMHHACTRQLTVQSPCTSAALRIAIAANTSSTMADASGDQVVLVRRATSADAHTIAQFNQAMAQETEGIAIPDDVAIKGVSGVLLPDGPAQSSAMYFVLEQQQPSEVVGQLMITLEWSDWRGGWIWWIQSVYVIPSCRGRGHFRRLYLYVREEAVKAGAAGLRLYADDDNTSAHKTYERLGMSSHYKVFEDMFTAY